MPNPTIMTLPAVVIAAAVALTTTAAHPPGSGGAARVELELVGVLPMPDQEASILVLREKRARTLLPLVVPREGADGNGVHHAGALLGRAIEALGGRVSEVEIDSARETRFGARVRLAQGGRRVELRARPSESVALALATGVPIVTTRRVLEQGGITPDDLARAHAKARRRETRL